MSLDNVPPLDDDDDDDDDLNLTYEKCWPGWTSRVYSSTLFVGEKKSIGSMYGIFTYMNG